MPKYFKLILALMISANLFISGCSNSPKVTEESQNSQGTTTEPAKEGTQNTTQTPEPTQTPDISKPDGNNTAVPNTIDYTKIKPNESGKVMVVMFHNFIEEYKSGDKAYTTTFDAFRQLLAELYEKGYRLISMSDYLNHRIDVPAGFKPMVFTFDDGTSGQFNLVNENGTLVANKNSAVGIMEEFNKTHPDFGLKGTFYVNLGLGTFQGEGSVAERLQYLISKGFEIGNHTATHIHLNQAKSAGEIQKEIGGNQKLMYDLIPGYKMQTFSLPYGQPAKDLQSYVVKSEFEGVQYEHAGIMEVGWDPNVSPVSKKFNPLSIHRVRSSGITPVDADLAWWLKNSSEKEQYISDGNPDTVTVPKAKETNVDKDKLNGKELITY